MSNDEAIVHYEDAAGFMFMIVTSRFINLTIEWVGGINNYYTMATNQVGQK